MTCSARLLRAASLTALILKRRPSSYGRYASRSAADL